MYYPENHNPEDGQTRIREHSDFGTITVLFQKDVGGLEVLSPQGKWITAPVIPGAPLINIGDFLQVRIPRQTCKDVKGAQELTHDINRSGPAAP